MPNRCGCANACSCLVVAGDGISVEGIGTLENPYEITSESSDLVGRIEFTDEGNVDFTQTGVGTLNDPTTVFADAVLAMSDLTDVPDTPPGEDGDILVWRLGGWVYEQPAEQGPTLPPGGVDGQVLTKQSSLDGDALWETLPAGGGGGSAVVEPVYAASRRHDTGLSVPSSTGTPVIVPWNIEDFTDGITYDPATMEYVIPVAGHYQVNVKVSFNQANATGWRSIRVGVNGASAMYGITYAAAQGAAGITSVSASRILKLAAGDRLSALAMQNSGVAIPLQNSAGYNTFDIAKVPALAPGGGGVVVDRPVAVSRRQAASISVTNGVPTIIPFDTEDYTDGFGFAGGVFTVPSDGIYQIDTAVHFGTGSTAGNRQVMLDINGTRLQANIAAAPAPTTAVGVSPALSRTVKLKTGDLVSIYVYQASGGTLTTYANAAWNYVNITKVPAAYSGSAVSTYGEQTYFASRGHSALTSIPNNVQTVVPLDSKVSGTDDSIPWNGTAFVIPVAGYYTVQAMFTFTGNAPNGARNAFIRLNGNSQQASAFAPNIGASQASAVASMTILCAAGDLVDVACQQNSGAALTLSGNNVYNRMSITKVPAPVVNGAAASGVWGALPLEATQYGSNDLLGREIFIDQNAQLRAKPEEIVSRLSSALPSTYPAGTTIMYVAGAHASAWPGGSIVVTHKTSNLVIAQWCYLWSAATTKSWYRNGTSAAWSPWVTATEEPVFGWCARTSSQSIAHGVVTEITGMVLNTGSQGVSLIAGGRGLIVPSDGLYNVIGIQTWTANTGGGRSIFFRRNGTSYLRTVGVAGSAPPSVQGSFNHVFSAGDEITMDAYQSSGVALGFDASNNGLSLQLAKLS